MPLGEPRGVVAELPFDLCVGQIAVVFLSVANHFVLLQVPPLRLSAGKRDGAFPITRAQCRRRCVPCSCRQARDQVNTLPAVYRCVLGVAVLLLLLQRDISCDRSILSAGYMPGSSR